MFTSVGFHDVERVKVERRQQSGGTVHVLQIAFVQTIGGEENRLEVTVFSEKPLSIDDSQESK